PAPERLCRRHGSPRAGRLGLLPGGRAGDPRRRHGLRRVATSPSRSHAGPLVGRSDECAALDRLLADAKAGQSAVVVRRGAAGTGKTALLDYAAEAAGGWGMVRAVGGESE